MKKCTVLITEDDSEDADFMRQALVANSFSGDIQHLANGQQLLNKLSEDKKANALPEMIILDINMPFKNGIEVLTEMNTDPAFRTITVAVVTASLRQEDEDTCSTLGCKLYLRKPNRFSEYKQVGQEIVKQLRSRFHYC